MFVQLAGDHVRPRLSAHFHLFPARDGQTTGIFLASVTPLTGTVVQSNVIRHVYYGIWTLDVPPTPGAANHFATDVTVAALRQ